MHLASGNDNTAYTNFDLTQQLFRFLLEVENCVSSLTLGYDEELSGKCTEHFCMVVDQRHVCVLCYVITWAQSGQMVISQQDVNIK